MKLIENYIIFLMNKAIIYSVKWGSQSADINHHSPTQIGGIHLHLNLHLYLSSISSLYCRNKCIWNAILGSRKAHKQLWGSEGQSQHITIPCMLQQPKQKAAIKH